MCLRSTKPKTDGWPSPMGVWHSCSRHPAWTVLLTLLSMVSISSPLKPPHPVHQVNQLNQTHPILRSRRSIGWAPGRPFATGDQLPMTSPGPTHCWSPQSALLVDRLLVTGVCCDVLATSVSTRCNRNFGGVTSSHLPSGCQTMSNKGYPLTH